MEDIHGVDVSWLHHTNRDHHHRQQAPSSPGLSRDAPPRTSAHGRHPSRERAHDERNTTESAPAVQQPSPPSTPSTPSSATIPGQKIPVKRPAVLSRGSSEKVGGITPPDSKLNSRRNSWISSISSKFSSQTSPAQTTHTQAQGSPATVHGVHNPTVSANVALNGLQAASGNGQAGLDPYVPQQPKGSFISNALRRLSSGTQVGTLGRVSPQSGVCPRRVMNVDRKRDRCLVPELDQSKLRRVAFCVDVEIAGGPKYKDDADTEERAKKRKEKRLKERGEGEALKRPDVVADEKDHNGTVTVNNVREVVGTDAEPNPEGTVLDDDKKELNKKKEKKKRSEAERKERKEKKRKKAEENGSVPLELIRDDDGETPAVVPAIIGTASPRPQDRPTTDPLRIYRRCCQLRETPILKRISDQLSAPSTCALASPGVVTCLDLAGSRLQLADVVTLSDWLAVVPVKKLFLEDADLNNEKLRVILAGLLAARAPETRNYPLSHNKPSKQDDGKASDRSGIIKKLVLKNNPKITIDGWRHISLFIYMCKSIVALDLSMIPFPEPRDQLSPQATNTTQQLNACRTPTSKDIAQIMSKAISERLGGACLEELVMAECSLTSSSVRRIIDGAVISGVQRLGLADNNLDDEGLDHVIHYIRSGVCQGLDLGGNDLREGLQRIVGCLTKDCPLWALSLADCDLTPESLRNLFPALVTLPVFRFLDLSHNKDLFSQQTSLCLLRKYVPLMKELKRIHLMDVSLSPAEAIGLAEILPECSHIAHVNILENPQISALTTATDEATQEEAAALYASLMVAARFSHTLICIDVDVPGPDQNEVVKALARQVVAYCLRNMESFSEIPELKPEQKEIEIPDVLIHLVGHSEGYSEGNDNDPPAPEDDYIVGGTGVVKALSYCLLQKATDLGRESLPASGAVTPRGRADTLEESGKAKTMSKNLLTSARNIQSRLQPALTREARAGNEMGYRRLLFLDQTLQGMIQRFEDEYPETRLQPTDDASTHSSAASTSPPGSSVPTLSTTITEHGSHESDDNDDEPNRMVRSRHNSDVSLASRALSLEEGRLHRLGHRVRTELLNPSRPTSSHSEANVSGIMDDQNLPEHLTALRAQFARYSGDELRTMTEGVGWEAAFDHIVDNAEQLEKLEKENPEEFWYFKQTQIAALKNRNPDIPPLQTGKAEEKNDCVVED
ncbi:RNI-like protein [Pleomassaria siparia CBS 279.74]|uniref:RNI-like protein n=1 Tax=Pleomassaria siparia CBS 279.74 TaxID=1314801 RepID=A0A6G1KAT7_9PLEO|nr:RNI-like protein [Pleomassaria siparia CBS 279.74]